MIISHYRIYYRIQNKATYTEINTSKTYKLHDVKHKIVRPTIIVSRAGIQNKGTIAQSL
jgi:hypothetical protein